MNSAPEFGAELGDKVSLCSLRSGPSLFGIDTRKIREVLGATTPQRVPLAPEYVAGVVPYRGEVLTTVCFRVLLGLERWFSARNVLVLSDEETEENFGLLVDWVGGVVTVEHSALEANPSALDARSMELFDGAYRMPTGLMVRLDPQRLRPSRLAESGLFAIAKSKQDSQGERR
ncbi:MAG: chemotaxis protein CheW [Acidobacteriaceae bacterium]|jgi:purine-binding chemotaxis protein CheW